MKVKIIRSNEDNYLKNINSFIGRIFTVIEEMDNECYWVYIPEWQGLCSVYKGEYEIIEE